MTDFFEANFDGLVGPTHNYAGLAYGNIASQTFQNRPSNPKAAALQGLAKMRFLYDLGIPQAILPPHERPHLPLLREHGYEGREEQLLKVAARDDPQLLAAAWSAAAMWTANAATVSPSPDTADHRVHITPANLFSNRHRAIEAQFTSRLLRQVLPDDQHFSHHPIVSGDDAKSNPTDRASNHFGDEGAANHLRLAATHGDPGIEVFVFGESERDESMPNTFPARQSDRASREVARRHGLAPDRVRFVRQNPAAIDAGVFHNDVIAVANEDVLLVHEKAYVDQETFLAELAEHSNTVTSRPPKVIEIADADLPLADAVRSYLFNSQIVTVPTGGMAMICPSDCEEIETARTTLSTVVEARDNPIRQVHFLDLRQSMQNGGGPACLRLRIVMNTQQWASVHDAIKLTPTLFDRLAAWIERHYREELNPADLADPALVRESRDALDKLSTMLALGSIYPFQQ